MLSLLATVVARPAVARWLIRRVAHVLLPRQLGFINGAGRPVFNRNLKRCMNGVSLQCGTGRISMVVHIGAVQDGIDNGDVHIPAKKPTDQGDKPTTPTKTDVPAAPIGRSGSTDIFER